LNYRAKAFYVAQAACNSRKFFAKWPTNFSRRVFRRELAELDLDEKVVLLFALLAAVLSCGHAVRADAYDAKPKLIMVLDCRRFMNRIDIVLAIDMLR
jgi:hypothetical protein